MGFRRKPKMISLQYMNWRQLVKVVRYLLIWLFQQKFYILYLRSSYSSNKWLSHLSILAVEEIDLSTTSVVLCIPRIIHIPVLISLGTSQSTVTISLSDPSMSNISVEVPSSTNCALCRCVNVDDKLQPCSHMIHGCCLKPSLQNTMGPPNCHIDNIPKQSSVLIVVFVYSLVVVKEKEEKPVHDHEKE